ncbi:TerD family protein [Variovorax sp. H27-G14]|uniref:TerD family protein n=1 Tax=Variovorax sp. H27-G14 TaxID=3111914 RepID=UPI0038FCC0E7
MNLTKPGEKGAKLSLNLAKDEVFTVQLQWDGSVDLDLHALACFGTATEQPKVTDIEQVLSTYNVKRNIDGQSVGVLNRAVDGTFEILNKALVHSSDATNGTLDGVDEWIRVDPAKLHRPVGGNVEIPLVAMVHPQNVGQTFAGVQNAEVVILNSTGKELLRANLSSQFGSFVGVQMGSVMIDQSGKAEFVQTAVGFNGDFNAVLENFS